MDEKTKKLLARAEARGKYDSNEAGGGLRRTKSLRAPSKSARSDSERTKSSSTAAATKWKPSMRNTAIKVKTMSSLKVPQRSGRRKSVGSPELKDGSNQAASEDDKGDKKSKEAAAAADGKPEAKLKKSDSLERLMAQINDLASLHPGASKQGDAESEDSDEAKKKRVANIVNVFAKAGPASVNVRSLKAVAQAEIRKEPTDLDKMLMQSKVVAAFGRRQFDRDEIEDPDDDDDEENEDALELKDKVKRAKSKYLEMFKKKDQKAEKEKDEKEDNLEQNRMRALGAWDQVTNLKVLPTLMRVKREWVPPDWDEIMEKMKEEGRDVATIDNDLKDISKMNTAAEKNKTGKYLMPEDIKWCRNRTRFKEKDLLNLFRRFRSESPKGEMNKEQMRKLFKECFPISDEFAFVDAVYEILDPEKEEALDFKDFIQTMDCVTCKTAEDKLRWASTLYTKNTFGAIDVDGLQFVLRLTDEIEENGFLNGPSEEELEELLYRKKLDPLKLVDERAQEIMSRMELLPDGRVNVEDLYTVSSKLIYARD